MKPLSISVLIITLIIGIGIGYALTPEYANELAMKNSPMKELGQADALIDQRYYDNMIAHHLNAIDMMNQALKSTSRQEIKDLANTIIKLDTESIAHLYQLKLTHYKDNREITRFSITKLGTPDENFDLRLLNALILHHDEAITSSKEMLSKTSKQDTINLANDVIQLLTTNKQQLLQWRKAWYNI